MSLIDTRREHMFPMLSPAEIDRLRRYGEVRHFSAGSLLMSAGKPSPGMIVLISGTATVTRRDRPGNTVPIVDMGAGEFIAEVGDLSGRPSLVDARAKTEVETLVIPPECLRRLMIAEAELGERIIRALILRRVALIEMGAGGPVLIGDETSPDIVRLQGFLARNGYPQQLLDPASDPDAKSLVERYAPGSHDLSLVICPDGTVLENPSEAALARCMGMVPSDALDRTHDVAVVGAGPAGLSTAVYAASEGLSVIVFDKLAFGGQAGASARIENYLGFPTGISGQALAGRAFVQAQKFGAEIAIPTEISRLRLRRSSSLSRSDRRPNGSRAHRGCGGRRTLSSTGCRQSQRFRGAWRLVLGFADRGANVPKRGGRSGGRRQLGGPGGGLSFGICEENLDAGARPRSR